jgi:acetolactate decarboxylase
MHALLSIIIQLSFLLNAGNSNTQGKTMPEVKITGQMRRVMMAGHLEATISLDTLTQRRYFYGFGPLEYLKGEIMVLDGQCYVSKVLNDRAMTVNKDCTSKAPFFAHAYIAEWESQPLPDEVGNMEQLEQYLLKMNFGNKRPYFFRLSGIVDEALIHVVNLPEGTVVKSPDDAHKGLVNYRLEKEAVEVLGFFSTEHQRIFTHHDTYMHLHLINSDKTMMGHVDDFKIGESRLRLLLPK